jgi:selenocysteine-specific elongation factor
MTVPNMADAAWRAVTDELAQKLQSEIAAGGFEPPWVRDLALTARALDDEVRAVLRKCVIQGA